MTRFALYSARKHARNAYRKYFASAFIRDIELDQLPPSTLKDVKHFVEYREGLVAPLYGMVVDELTAKADPYNFQLATEHIIAELAAKDHEKETEEFHKKKDKYILIVNDRIVDGHHYLARAKQLAITSSLKVLDLTGTRFQEKQPIEPLLQLSKKKACIAVDLDGTLAHYTKWKGNEHIGQPIPKMLERVKKWIEDGKTVKIFTARADDPESIPCIEAWLKKHGLPKLEITNKKDPSIDQFWDDRAVSVQKNTGKVLTEL